MTLRYNYVRENFRVLIKIIINLENASDNNKNPIDDVMK